MNETLLVIQSRRSIRHYRPDQIKTEDIKTIVEAGIYAPSAMNQQKWHFTVVRNKGMLDKMMATVKTNILSSDMPGMKERAESPDFNVYYNAPAVIIITADEDARFTEIDCGIAAENMALAAASLGIGSVLLGMGAFALEGDAGKPLKNELGIPDNYQHIISISLGYNAEEAPPMPAKNFDVINYVG